MADDAPDLYALMTNERLTYIPADKRPTSLAQLVKAIEQPNSGADNGPKRRRYQWVARRRDNDVAVAVVVSDLEYRHELVTTRDADNNIADVSPSEVRVAEATVYVHPEHQEANGSYWGTKSVELAWGFARDQFGCTVRRALIELTNTKSIRRAESNGMVLVRRGTSAGVPGGYGVWEGPLG